MIKEIALDCLNIFLISLLISLVFKFLYLSFKFIKADSIKRSVIFVFDVISLNVYTVLNILALYFCNSGQFRWYYLFSEILGIIIVASAAAAVKSSRKNAKAS